MRERHNELVKREAVHKEQFSAGRAVRGCLMNVPNRVAGIVAAETDQHKTHDLLTKELYQALEGLHANA